MKHIFRCRPVRLAALVGLLAIGSLGAQAQMSASDYKSLSTAAQNASAGSRSNQNHQQNSNHYTPPAQTNISSGPTSGNTVTTTNKSVDKTADKTDKGGFFGLGGGGGAGGSMASGSYSTGGSQQFSLPGFSSMSNSGNTVTLFDANFNLGGGIDLGCGGIGLMSFMNSTFDLGNIVEEFKGALTSKLSKTLVTFAMSTPQIASLFDTLNAFGNARFDLFKESCDIGQIRQEVKQAYMEKCIASGKAPDQCTNMEGGGVQKILNDTMAKFGGVLRSWENVSEGLRGSICSDSNGAYNPNTAGCMAMAFLPQMKICLRAGLGETCTGDDYGSRDPAISLGTMADAGTLAAGRAFSRIDSFNSAPSVMNFTRAQKQQAMQATYLALANGELPASYTAPTASASDQKLIDELKSELACPKDDYWVPVLLYREKLAKLKSGIPAVNTVVNITDIEKFLNDKLSGGIAKLNKKDAEGVKQALGVGLNCLMARHGATDPALLIALSEASADDRASFIQSEATEIGSKLSIGIARVLITQLRSGAVQLEVDQIGKPVAEQAENFTGDPKDFKAENEEAAAQMDAAKDPIKKAVDAMIATLEASIREEEESLKNTPARVMKFREIKARQVGIQLDGRALHRSGR